ncbi:MAG: DedA family protein [Actinomycetota bacterium]|nr:DedA family protein [Actinomycetota bacterium]
MSPEIASITASLADTATSLVGSAGLVGIFLLMTLESACIPIPSEVTMLFAGFNVATHHYSLLSITVAGVVGNLVGSWLAYGVGYYGRLELLERHGRALHISPGQLARADRWFERYGSVTVLVTRVMPLVRTFISLPAGAARMPFWRFSALTVAGCIPWVLLLGWIGLLTKSNWHNVKDGLAYVDYFVVVGVVVGIVYLVVRRRRDGGSGGPETAADAGS